MAVTAVPCYPAVTGRRRETPALTLA